MNHWPFILAAYGATALGTVGLIVASFAAMRSAERDAEALKDRK